MIKLRVQFECDGRSRNDKKVLCGEFFQGTISLEDFTVLILCIKRAITMAQNHGWTIENGKCYCPECSRPIKMEINDFCLIKTKDECPIGKVINISDDSVILDLLSCITDDFTYGTKEIYIKDIEHVIKGNLDNPDVLWNLQNIGGYGGKRPKW